MADKAQTWVYTEDYVAESDALTAARAVATEMGASPVSPGTGAALRMLAAVSGARAVLEVGTGAGVSGLWLLDGMAADGVLTTIDSESELLGHARRNFAAAGLSPPEAWVYIAAAAEVAVAFALILGLCTRFAALGSVALMAVAVYSLQTVKGFGWTWNTGGYEYPVFWGICSLAVAVQAWKAWAGQSRRALGGQPMRMAPAE